MFNTRNITITNGNKTRFFDSGGDKECIILIHGLANSIEIWERVIPELSKKFRVVAFDIPGFGQANRPDADYDSPFFVEQLAAFMDTMGISKAHLVSTSLV